MVDSNIDGADAARPLLSYDQATQTKMCYRCRERLPVSLFAKRRNHGRDPYCGYCTSCSKAKYAEWVSKNRERKRAYLKTWYEENREANKAYDAERWARPETREKRRRLVRANKDRYNSYYQNYRALKVGAPGTFTDEDIARIKKMQRCRCAVCRKKLPKSFHRDHIVPLSKGGTNHPSNIQLLCAFCNLSKADRDAIEFMRDRGLLL